MRKELYLVTGIKFLPPSVDAPSLVVDIPQYVWSMGVEDFEEEGFDDELENMDEEEAEEFWDSYEGSDEAHARFDEAFSAEVLNCVKEHFPSAVGFDTFQPATLGATFHREIRPPA